MCASVAPSAAEGGSIGLSVPFVTAKARRRHGRASAALRRVRRAFEASSGMMTCREGRCAEWGLPGGGTHQAQW